MIRQAALCVTEYDIPFEWSAASVPNLFKIAGRKNWYCWYYEPGTRVQKVFSCKSTDKNEAKRSALDKLASIYTGETSRKLNSQLLSEFAKEYIEFVKGAAFRPKSVLAIESSFRLFLNRIGDKPLSKIRLEECQKFIFTGQPSQFTARKHYGHLRAAFRKAVEWERLQKNPFEQFKKPRAPQYEAEYLNEREFQQLYDAFPTSTFADRRLQNICLLVFETGMRLGEVRHLERKAIDYQTNSLVVVNSESFKTKADRSRIIPLSHNALQAIHNQTKDNHSNALESIRESPYLFPNEQGLALSENAVTMYFREIRQLVFPKRTKLHFHSLRHSYGTNLALAGVPLQEIQKAMGHSTISVTERYAHLQRLTFPNLRKVQAERRKIAPEESPLPTNPHSPASHSSPSSEQLLELLAGIDLSDLAGLLKSLNDNEAPTESC